MSTSLDSHWSRIPEIAAKRRKAQKRAKAEKFTTRHTTLGLGLIALPWAAS